MLGRRMLIKQAGLIAVLPAAGLLEACGPAARGLTVSVIAMTSKEIMKYIFETALKEAVKESIKLGFEVWLKQKIENPVNIVVHNSYPDKFSVNPLWVQVVDKRSGKIENTIQTGKFIVNPGSQEEFKMSFRNLRSSGDKKISLSFDEDFRKFVDLENISTNKVRVLG